MNKSKKVIGTRKAKCNNINYIFKEKYAQEKSNRDENENILLRYLDYLLKKELNHPGQQTNNIKRVSSIVKMELRWDSVTRNFIVYYCRKHNFYPDSTTIKNKCAQNKCFHLYPRRKKEIIVKSLKEALLLKGTIDTVQIEQNPSGFRVIAY